MKGSLRQRSSGTWELIIDMGRDATGKRRRKYATVRGVKSAAQRELRRLLTTLDQGVHLPVQKILLRDWLRQWMRDVIEPKCRRHTISSYGSIIERLIIPPLGHVPLDKVTPVHVHNLYQSLYAGGYSASSVQRIHSIFSGALKYAVRMEAVQRNPAAVVSPPARRRREITPPDIPAVRRALALAREEEHPLHAAIHLIAYTGLRRGEALALQWNNVDLNSGFVLVEASLVPVKGELLVEPPKTRSGRRIVDLDDGTVDVLARHRDDQDIIKELMGPAYRDEGRVFANERGAWIHPLTLTRAVKTIGKRVGFPSMTVHGLRHFHASVALQTGQNIVVVSKRLGHSNVSITSDIYAHALPGWQQETADAFAEAMQKGT